ncbi:MAG: glycosyltransferase family 2 protein [Lysobacter sp.]
MANVYKGSKDDEAGSWICGNDDPQFLLGAPNPALQGGWYLLDAVFLKVEGRLVSPSLYPDYGEGMSEYGRITLPDPDEFGRVRSVVRFTQPLKHLRFDPSTRPTRFVLEGVGMRRLGRMEALLRMLAGTREPGPPWRRFLAAMVPFVRTLLDDGMTAAGELVYSRYMQPSTDDYSTWVRNYDTLTPTDISAMRDSVDPLADKPLVSILLPVYQPPDRWLRRCLDSVLAQVYPHWQLCIADDASPSPRVRNTLQEYAARDSRIHLRLRESNGHISKATNSALEMAEGEFVALLDNDDELPPHALLEIVKAINANPQWQMIYSDEDKVDADGRRFQPYFKPDWNHELLLAQNCVSHLGVYRTDLVREVGGFRVGFEGSQDWDLALRCAERLRSDEIGHVPKVLYHWRAIAGSTAAGVDQKSYVVDAGVRAVSEHLQRMGRGATVEPNRYGHLNVRYDLPPSPPRVSLIIPTRDKVDLLRVCINSILETTDYPDYEIIVVDNQSQERPTLDYFRELESEPRVTVLRYDQPFNYSAINNYAVIRASGSVIGLVNNDIEAIHPEWLSVMVAQAVRPEIGAVGAMLYYPDDTIQHAGVVVGFHGVAGHVYTGLPAGATGQCGRAILAQEMSAVTAACLLVRKAVFTEVDGLDEELSVAFNDIDFCLRLREAGYRNVWTPYASLYHHESASRGYEDTPEKKARFKSEVDLMTLRWGQMLDQDPNYNPNLTLSGSPFDLAFPPRLSA